MTTTSGSTRSFSDVRIGLGAVSAGDEIITGLLLFLGTEDDIETFFEVVREYFETPLGYPRAFNLAFDTQRRTFDLSLESSVRELHLHVDKVESEVPEGLIGSLGRYPYYYILTGRIDTESSSGYELSEVPGHHLYKSDLIVDGKYRRGNRGGPWPTTNPLLASYDADTATE